MEHPLTADVGCRNTAVQRRPAELLREVVPALLAHGIGELPAWSSSTRLLRKWTGPAVSTGSSSPAK